MARWFLLLAALFSSVATASVPRTVGAWESNPPAAVLLAVDDVTTPGLADLHLSLDLAGGEPSARFRLFEPGPSTLVEADGPESFHPLQGVELIDTESRRGPPVSYPETRVWVIEVLGTTFVGEATGLSVELRPACGGFSCGVVSDDEKDPLGLMGDDDETYVAHLSMPPTPELDALPKLTPPAEPSPEPSLWARFTHWRGGLVRAAQQGIRNFWHTEAKQSELQREADDDTYKTAPQLAAATADVQAVVGGVVLEAGQAIVETQVGTRIVQAVVGAGGKIIRVLRDLGPVRGPGKYVKRAETMSAEAKGYEEAVAKGRPGEAYEVPYSNPNPRGRPVVNFDGVTDTGIPLDAKISIVTRQKTVAQAARQAEALRQHQTIGVWKVTTVKQAVRAREMIRKAKAEDVLRIVVESN